MWLIFYFHMQLFILVPFLMESHTWSLITNVLDFKISRNIRSRGPLHNLKPLEPVLELKIIRILKTSCVRITLREKCPNMEFFMSVFSRIRTEYGEIRSFSPNTGKLGPKNTPYLDTFHAVLVYFKCNAYFIF